MPPAERKQLFYFNGLNSRVPEDLGETPKIAEVAALARRQGFVFHPVSVDYRRAAEQSREVLQQVSQAAEHVIFWGSSMGGWFARIMQLKLAPLRPGLRIEAAAYNPAFDLVEHGHILVGPQVHKYSGEVYQWTEENSAALADLERSVDYDAPLPYFVYVDRDDEVIDADMSEARLRKIARFRVFEGGSHSFEHYAEAVRDFESVVAQAPGSDRMTAP
jgi:predicted esterase YcpF (UPF0227 family)